MPPVNTSPCANPLPAPGGNHRDFLRISPDVKLGRNVMLYGFVNLYGCTIGDDTRVGCFVEIQTGVSVGSRCKISSHTFICEGVTIEDEVFVGHGVTFINDRWPRATNASGTPLSRSDWQCLPTRVGKGASIGSGSTILGGVTIGENAMVGAGSVVTHDVPPHTTVAGNPARPIHGISNLAPDGSQPAAAPAWSHG